jgi:hypothetical protein
LEVAATRRQRLINPSKKMEACAVDIPLGTLKLTCVEAMTRQIEAAIDALQRGDYDIAVTLAGAAEGMIQREGLHMFAYMRDSPKVQAKFSKKDWIATINRELYWLKHGGQNEMNIECSDAAIMIARAASKLGKWTPKMEEFRIWLKNNIDAI